MIPPQDLVERGLELIGGDRGLVIVAHEETANLRWANSTLTTNGLAAHREVRVVVQPEMAGGLASGTAAGSVREAVELVGLVARARAAALDAGPAQDAAEPAPLGAAPSDWDAEPHGASPDVLAPAASLLGEALADPSAEWFGYAEQSSASTWMGTTAGHRLRTDQPAARFELCGKSDGRTRSAWAGRTGRSLAGLDLAGTVPEVLTGLAHQAHRLDLSPGPARVTLSPSAVADLLLDLVWSAGALDAVEGRSAFSRPAGRTRLGESLTRVPVWIRSDPDEPGLECAPHVMDVVSGPMSSPFDAGLPLRATDWVRDGHLRALVGTRHAARLAGIAHTPAVDNLIAGVTGTQGSLDEVAARMSDGLLITCLWYIRDVDAPTLLLTGLTRDGVYVVRGGEIVGATGNFRFNESPLGMLGRIVDAGTPVPALPREWADWFTRAKTPPLVVEGFHLSTASEAL